MIQAHLDVLPYIPVSASIQLILKYTIFMDAALPTRVHLAAGDSDMQKAAPKDRFSEGYICCVKCRGRMLT